MKRLLVCLSLLAVVLVGSAVSAADVELKKFDPQMAVSLKKTLDVGNGFNVIPKVCMFMATDFSQPWGYVQLNRYDVTGSLGIVANYRTGDTWFAALKLNRQLADNWVTTHEYYWIDAENDAFYWGLLDYMLNDRNGTFIGVYWEVFKTDAARLQIGPHVGMGDFEIDLLLGERVSNIRLAYTYAL